MHPYFEQMYLRWFDRAHFYAGSITDRDTKHVFCFRYEQSGDEKELKVSTYSNVCYEKANDVEEQSFPWTEEGVEQLKQWYQAQYEKFLQSKG